MADSSIGIPMAEDLTNPVGGNSRQRSTGKIISANSVDKIPHYLRAPTGSCHDMCKYGRKHAFEEKERCPIRVVPRRLSTKSLDSQPAVSVVLPERKKMSVIKFNHSLESKTISPDSQPEESIVLPEKKKISVIKLNHSPESQTLSPDACTIAKQVKRQLLQRSADRKPAVGSEPFAERKKLSLVKFKASSGSKPPVSAPPKTVKQEGLSTSEKLKVSSEKGWTRLKEKDLSTKHVTSLKPKSVATKELACLDTSGCSEGISNSNAKLGQRTVTSLKPNSLAIEQNSFLDSSGGLKDHRKSEAKISKRAGTPLVTLKKVLVSPTGSLSPRPSLRRVASLKTQNRNVKVTPLQNQNKIAKCLAEQLNNDETPEKTLYVIKLEIENQPLESDQNKVCEGPPPSSSSSSPKSLLSSSISLSQHNGEDQESEYTSTETEDDSFSEDDEADINANAETLDVDYKGRPRKKSGMVGCEDVGSHPVKFRRGKVVDMKFENNRPRRLNFRRGKVLGENENVKSEAERRRYKKTEGVDGNAIGTEPGAEKVILRHQDVQGKKDEKGLFNNVIEETASKLVEIRKSKVQALVGAFETVISLQEHKPSATSIS